GDPLAKLLDFGIAKLVGAAGEDASGALTQTAGAAMTPAYAAPEQLAGTEITTATDVYALGVVLYEVLTGERPYDLSGVTAAEAERIVRQTVPPRPSAVAGNRQLAGDLDVIVAKALAKEPERRYESAAALGDDLKRHLDGLPVEAQPATVGYRVGRFVQRHRAGVLVAAAALVVVFGVAGLAFARVSAERDRAQTEADKAQAVTDFLSSTFGAAGPSAGTAVPPSELRVVDALGFAASEATRSFPDQLDVRAAVLHTLGQTLVDLGLYNDALGPLLASLALRDSVHGGRPHPETLETLDALGLVGLWKAESDQDYGALYYRRALTMREALYGETSAEVSRGLANLAETEIERGQFAEAIALAQRALDIARVAEGPMSEAAGDAGFALGRAYGFAGQFRAADSTLTSLLPIARALLPPDDARWGELYTAIGQARLLRGATQAAVDVLEQAATSRAARFDPGHPLLAETQGVLGIALVESGRHQDAEPLLRAALPTFRTGDPYWFYQHATAAVLEASLAQRGLPARLDSARTSAALLADAVGRESPWSQIVERHLESAGG
ncbi:MAG: tetratricopeptide repeat-containing protein kinase family protein, partial [Bacteroidota bacterium]